MVIFAPSLVAQEYPNNLSTDSVDPHADSLFFAQTRAQMDYIRRNQKRPTVGLVLSGGGAKGAAEVGVLKYLEEMNIPIDLICGTSIGGLIGAIYSIGYTSDDIKELFLSQDWDMVLSDKLSYQHIPYKNKMDRAQYLITVPFDLEKIFKEESFNHQHSNSSFAASLPSGIASGFNVNNLISSLTIGYQDSLDFSTLPIPFVCVASDLVSGKAKNWTSGSLNDAMRSTMSIPGLFMPLRTEDAILVDGGTRNNFPCDIAKAMGADIIIGVDLAQANINYDNINNIGNIASRFIDMLSNDAYNKNIKIPDIYIKPDLKEYDMLSFNSIAIDTMIIRGYEAAQAKEEELVQLKKRVRNIGPRIIRKKAINLANSQIQIGNISFEGINDRESQVVSNMLMFEAGDIVSKGQIDSTLNTLKATGVFKSVKYRLEGTGSPYDLVFECESSPNNNLRLGFRADSEEWASLLLNIGLNNNTLSGSRFNLTAKIGQNFKGTMHYELDMLSWPTLNFDISAASFRGDLNYPDLSNIIDAAYWTHKEQLYITDARWNKSNFKLGIKNQYIEVDERSYLASLITQTLSKGALKGDYLGAFASWHFYSFDDYYFPQKGQNLELFGYYDFLKFGRPDFHPVIKLGMNYKSVLKLSDKWALIPELYLRGIINTGVKVDDSGTYKDLSVLHTNFIGSYFPGRYTDTQVPFFAINDIVNADEYLTSTTMELRFNPYNSLYLSAIAGIVESNDNIGAFISDFNPDYFAAGLQAAYNTAIGPLKINIHWSNMQKWGSYISLGFDF